MTPNGSKDAKDTKKTYPPIQMTVLDLATFDDVKLEKDLTFEPVNSVQEAQAKLGGDSAKLIAVINDGLEQEARRAQRKDPSGYMLLDKDGKRVDASNVQPANSKVVNACVLNLAKSVFGLKKEMTTDKKNEIKDKTRDFIKSNPVILAGLKEQAAIGAGVELEDADETETEEKE
jgi:hypothetical protein